MRQTLDARGCPARAPSLFVAAGFMRAGVATVTLLFDPRIDNVARRRPPEQAPRRHYSTYFRVAGPRAGAAYVCNRFVILALRFGWLRRHDGSECRRLSALPAGVRATIRVRDHENKMTVSKPRLVFLLANYFSGATLLTILLSGHEEIVSNGEAMFFDDGDEERYDCTCGKFIDECEFYGSAAAHMRLPDGSGWDKQLFVHAPRFSRNRILRSFLGSWRYESALRDHFINAVPAYRRIRDRFIEAQLQFFANARNLSGAPIYLDGTKSVRRAQLFARDGRSDIKVIHLIRDGRGF